MTYFVTDPLQDTTGIDHTLVGQPVSSDPSLTWIRSLIGVWSQPILRAAAPRYLSASVTGGVAAGHVFQVLPTGQVITDSVKIVQCGLKLTSVNDIVQGVSFYRGLGADINSVMAGLIRDAGTPKWIFMRSDGTTFVEVARGNLPFIDINDNYCVRLKHDAQVGWKLYIAVMDESANPSNSFNQVYFDNSTVLVDFMALGCFHPSANFSNCNYYNPMHSDGSYPYQFFAQSYTGTVNAQFQMAINPFGYGWVASGVFDFTLSNSYTYTFPNNINDTPAFFALLEFINIGNQSPVRVQIGQRRFIVPPNQTVTLNMDPYQYQQIIVSSTDGAVRLNAYDKVAVQYQSLR